MPAFESWPAIDRATAHDAKARRPFRVLEGGQLVPVGSVDRRHLPVLSRWPSMLAASEHGADLLLPDQDSRSRALAEIHSSLREDGLLPGWRDEPYPIVDGRLEVLAVIERAASRFWGTLTFGAHCNGFVREEGERPTHLWIARRSADKATDPGRLDNLVGGGVRQGQSMRQTIVREGWEEAGLKRAFASRAVEGRVVSLDRDIPEGRQNEWIQVYDLEMPASFVPSNQDGEVMGFARLTIAEALECAAGDEMTVDASLVTLDFALRRFLFDAPTQACLDAAAAALWRERPGPRAGIRWR